MKKRLMKTNGHAKEHEGLCLLGSNSTMVIMSLSHFSEKFSLDKAQIWLHHLRLGHPSFLLLTKMFSLLFNKLDVNRYHCEIWQLAKHHCASFPLSSTKSISPFLLIHTNVWASRISSLSRAMWFCVLYWWLY